MRIGVIGLGTVGLTHLEALRAVGVDDVLGADPSAGARKRAVAYLADSFVDYRQMITTAKLDAVVVATPPRTHCEIAIDALQAGLSVLCEKPLGLTLEDCEAVAAEVGHARGIFQVGFCHRFQPQVSELRAVVESGAIGQLVLVNISFVHGLTEQGREWITNLDQAGGGVLFDSGSHAIDIFRYLIGDVDDVHGLTTVLDAGVSRVEDVAVASLRSGGVLGSITLSWKTPPWLGLVEVVGTGGRARVDYDGDIARLRTRLGEAPWQTVRTTSESRFVGQMRHFLASVRGEACPLATVRDGLEATRLILRIYNERRN